MKQFISWLLFFLFCFLVAFTFLLGNALWFAYSKNTYQKLLTQNQELSLSQADRNHLADSIYRGLTQQKSVQAILENGELAFSDKEIIHMQDVAQLLKVLLSCLALLSIVLFLWYRRYRRQKVPYLSYFPLFSILLTLLFVLLILLTFSSSFTWFHELSFSNDFWLLDIEQDLLINLFPLSFFIITFAKLGFMTILELTLFYLLRRKFSDEHPLFVN